LNNCSDVANFVMASATIISVLAFTSAGVAAAAVGLLVGE